MIEFLLHNDKITLDDIDPNTTVLQFLRDNQQRTGTKEGCASGDCGACTVTTVELNKDSELVYKSINACITFVGALAGKQLICVEDLKADNQLHSAQQAMVDTDGSQCGFCTPGFVMSLFTLQKNQQGYDRHKVQQALAGNLCRCTGYRAIDNAAKQMLSTPVVDHFDPLESSTIQKLADINATKATTSAVLSHLDKQCYAPSNTDQLAEILLQFPDSQLVAGATDLAISVTQHGQSIQRLVSVANVEQLQQVNITDDHIEIGAAVSLNECQRLLEPYFPDFAQLLERFASLQIRNQGTLGGNIANASPIGDTPPALIALDASVILRKGAVTRTLKLSEFFIDYRKTALSASEFIENIVIPMPQVKPNQRHVLKIYKISKRLDDDISAICAAHAIVLDDHNKVIDIKLAYGGMAAIAKRALKAEQALLNQTLNNESIESALLQLSNDFSPLSDFRASSDYRLRVAQNLMRKFLIELNASAQNNNIEQTRIFDYV